MEDKEQESKVVYLDGNRQRVIRGIVTTNGDFVKVKRRDGVILIKKEFVQRIETWNKRDSDEY